MNVENTPLLGNDSSTPLGTLSSVVVHEISDRKDDTDKGKKLATFAVKATRNSYFSFQTNDPCLLFGKTVIDALCSDVHYFSKWKIFGATIA